MENDLELCDQVFVYGTLKSGVWNNSLLSSSELVGEAVTMDKYVLFGNNGEVPHMVPSLLCRHGGDRHFREVKGEVWRMDSADTFQSLDYLEGEGSYYHRRLIEVASNGWTEMPFKVWAYIVIQPVFSIPEDRLANVNIQGEYEWLM